MLEEQDNFNEEELHDYMEELQRGQSQLGPLVVTGLFPKNRRELQNMSMASYLLGHLDRLSADDRITDELHDKFVMLYCGALGK